MLLMIASKTAEYYAIRDADVFSYERAHVAWRGKGKRQHP